jgi:hypothetical protein
MEGRQCSGHVVRDEMLPLLQEGAPVDAHLGLPSGLPVEEVEASNT